VSQDINIEITKKDKSCDQIKSIKIINFRSYEDFSLDFSGKPVAMIGDNGIGKTNILEAISLFSPGRGIRNASFSEMIKDNNSKPWGISSDVLSDDKKFKISSGIKEHLKGRDIKVNEKKVSGSSVLPEIILISWLTPSMDQIFNESPSYRRKFIDRLCAVYEKDHTKNLKMYEKLMRERNLSFKNERIDNVWLEAIEYQMANVSILIAETRLIFISNLNKILESNLHSVWPKAYLELSGFVEDLVASWNEEKAKRILCETLRDNREKDYLSKRTNKGVHISDLIVTERNKKIEAKKCSTGEQKSLLMGIVLSHLELVSNLTSRYPVLLLDEVLAHFDKIRRQSFFEQILDIGSQIMMTGTDISIFENLDDLEIIHMNEIN